MRWLYQLQARFGLAASEGTAALVLVLALAAGTVARHVQARAATPPDLYAASDAAFERANADAPLAPVTTISQDEPSSAPIQVPFASDVPAALNETAPENATVETPRPAPRRSAKKMPVRTGINTASESDLQRLPGIGPALAGRVVAYRQQHGRFRTADQLVEVKGIGPKTLEKMRPWVVID